MPLLLELTPRSAQLSAQGSRGFIPGGCPAVCLCLQDWGFVLCGVLLPPPPLYPFLLLCGQT